MKNPHESPVEIPAESLSPEALRGVIENFVQREGTDYGSQEILWETKISQLEKQITRGDVIIVFDSEEGSVSLLTKEQWKKKAILTSD